ncbi:MAG: choice-of-anchor Q domain-containing protein [Bacteroidia bacterium]
MPISRYINFEIGSEMQQVLVRAKILDAYLWRTTARDSNGELVLVQAITRDTTFATDKFTVIDGPLFITNGATLTLQAGTRLAFSPFRLDPVSGGNPLTDPSTFEFRLFSMIYVDDGSLKVQGEAGNPVLMQGTRFDTTVLADYNELPGQWRGIQFSKNSKGNELRHLQMKNGLLGIRVDSVSYDSEPKLRMEHVEIRNMAAYGLQVLGFNGSSPDDLGTTPQVLAENCLIYNCKERTVSISGGGWQEFYNCTFASYPYNYSRRNPSFALANYLTLDGQVIEEEYAQKSLLVNCAVYGSEEEELLIENFNFYQRAHEVRFENCLVRTSTDADREYDYEPYFFDVIQNLDPLFHNSREFDYRPEENSPLIDAGKDLSSRFSVDFRDDPAFMRTLPYDIGAFEYYEIE